MTNWRFSSLCLLIFGFQVLDLFTYMYMSNKPETLFWSSSVLEVFRTESHGVFTGQSQRKTRKCDAFWSIRALSFFKYDHHWYWGKSFMFQLVCVCVRAYVYTLCTDTNVYTHAQWYFSNQTSFNRIMFSDAQWFCFKANQEQVRGLARLLSGCSTCHTMWGDSSSPSSDMNTKDSVIPTLGRWRREEILQISCLVRLDESTSQSPSKRPASVYKVESNRKKNFFQHQILASTYYM